MTDDERLLEIATALMAGILGKQTLKVTSKPDGASDIEAIAACSFAAADALMKEWRERTGAEKERRLAVEGDKDRLDFIERMYAHVQFRVDRFDPEERVLVDAWTVDCGDIYPRGINGPKHEMAIDAGTLRDAIDAAMEADRAIREARRGE